MKQSRKAEFFQQVVWTVILLILGLVLLANKISHSRLAELTSKLRRGCRKQPQPCSE
jgi:di/tricarboxylate transporter